MHHSHIIIIVSQWILGIAFEAIIHRLNPLTNVSIVENGQDGLQLVEQNRTNLVILDDTLVSIDGFSLTHTLRASGYPNPILVISRDMALQEPLKEAGAWLLLRGPGLADELAALLPQLHAKVR